MTKLYNERRSTAAESVFKLLLFVYTGLGSCNLTYGKPVISYVMYAAFVLGGCILLARLVCFRRYYTMPLLACAVLMWASYVFSSAVNASYITKNSVVYLILWSFYFFILYTHPADRPAERVLREFRLVCVLYAVWVTALVIISIGMLFRGWSWAYRDPNNADYEVASGFFSGRLWGAFQDPIMGSVMCSSVIAMCGYWFMRRKKTWLRVLLALEVLAMVFYMAMADSRNGMICLGVVCAGAGFFLWFGRQKEFTVRRRVIGVILAVVVLAGGTLLPKAVQRGYNEVADLTGWRQVDRGYDIYGSLENFSNRRLSEWRSAIEIGSSRPLTGVSFTGVVPYAQEYMPETYIVNNDYWVTNTLESEIFNIFAAQGLPGLITLLAWFLLAVLLFFRKIGQIPSAQLPEVALMTILVCELVVSALFQGVMFYQVTPNAVLFWIAFGGLLFVLNGAERKVE